MGNPYYPLATRAGMLHAVLDGVPLKTVERRSGLGNGLLSIWARHAGFMINTGSHGGLTRPATPDPIGAASGHGRRLGLADRVMIQIGVDQGFPYRQIAAMVGVAPSTISREIRAHALTIRGTKSYYDARVANQASSDARSRPRAGKLEVNLRLRGVVVSKLNQKFSPEQVAATIREEYADEEEMRVSHETIYQALYVQGKGALRHELTVEKALRSGRTTRKPQSRLPARVNRPWLAGARLSDRPAAAADRAVPGHWEGDLVVGPENSGIITLVERRSRFALIGRLPGCRDSATVTSRLQEMIQTLPDALFASITWDQGTEMAAHAAFTVATGCPIFFCDPHAPWQRGSNENLNGLIRDFYPKGTNFNQVTDGDLAHTQTLLNIRPRKTLGWATPAATLGTHIQQVALTT